MKLKPSVFEAFQRCLQIYYFSEVLRRGGENSYQQWLSSCNCIAHEVAIFRIMEDLGMLQTQYQGNVRLSSESFVSVILKYHFANLNTTGIPEIVT